MENDSSMRTIEPHLVSTGDAFARIGLIHRVRVPAVPGPYPTVVMLHGLEGDENAMWVFEQALPENWLLISPRAILSDPQSGYTWCSDSSDHFPPQLELFDEAANAIVRLVHVLPEVYATDPARVYLMGFSQGAAVAYASALRQPGIVKGIAALLGFIPAGVTLDTMRNAFGDMPIFMAIGRRDPRIPLERAQADATALRQAGALLGYHEYDASHKLTSSGLHDLAKWWMETNRNVK